MTKRTQFILLGILILAAALRLYRLDQHDVITDEVFYGYRSIGLIDSLNSPYQPTPFEWFPKVPLWAKFSFHDHPPLGFWIEHWFFKLFGVNLWALRLPFVLAGVASVWLVYLIAQKLFGKETTALLSAGILAINNYHVWVSRIGLQESLVIFFLLLAVLLFLKTLENKRFFYWTIVAAGGAVLMKYTAVVLFPIFFVYLIWKRRDLLSFRRVAISLALLLVILAPVIIYNIGLYHTRGHFDYQISYLLHERVPEWQVRPGREVGGLRERFPNFFGRFVKNFGIVFTLLSVIALGTLGLRRREGTWQFLGLCLLFLFLLIIAIGPQERFLAMPAPFLAILLAGSLDSLFRFRKSLLASTAVLFVLELGFTINTNHAIIPQGREGLTYSQLRRESNIWGYNQLEKKFQEITHGYYPEQTFPVRFGFAQDLQRQALERARREGRQNHLILFVADSRLHGPSYLWYITRHTVYDRWPFIDDQVFVNALAEDKDFFRKQGFTEVVFIKAENTLLRPDITGEAAIKLAKVLQSAGVAPEYIESLPGKIAFSIYHIKEK